MDVPFFSPFELRRNAYYDRLFVFGSPQWYARNGLDFLFHAPRSPVVEVITFRWINNRFPDAPGFPGCQPPIYRAANSAGVVIHQAAETESDLEDALAVLPAINVEKLKIAAGGKAPVLPGAADDDDEAEAKLFTLSGNKAVFLEMDDSASSYVIDFSGSSAEADQPALGQGTPPETEAETYFGRRLNSDLEPGMFLLLRTEGGGDLVQHYADQILAASSNYKSELQLDWKKSLASRLREQGAESILEQLLAHGGTRVILQTIRNWMSIRNIRPDSPNFEALLKILGFGSSIDAIARNAKIIRCARMSAGMHIRRLLLVQIKKADLSALYREGAMIFHLADAEAGGSMTACRIERILPDLHLLPYTQIGHPIELTEDLWH